MEHSGCFIGHRKTKETYELKKRLECVLSELIQSGTVNFIFGDHSDFNSLCYKAVTELKEKHPEIRRIHFRKDYEDANEYTMGLLIAGYEKRGKDMYFICRGKFINIGNGLPRRHAAEL